MQTMQNDVHKMHNNAKNTQMECRTNANNKRKRNACLHTQTYATNIQQKQYGKTYANIT